MCFFLISFVVNFCCRSLFVTEVALILQRACGISVV